jgi:hypothetical protein
VDNERMLDQRISPEEEDAVPCGAWLPKFRKNGLGITIEYNKHDEQVFAFFVEIIHFIFFTNEQTNEQMTQVGADQRQYLSAEKALKSLQRIRPADAIALGFDPR